MKKIYLLPLSTIILFSNACTAQNTSSIVAQSESVIESSIETTTEKETESTVNENTYTYETTSTTSYELPNTDDLSGDLAEIFVLLKLDSTPPLTFENYENISGIINIDICAETEKCNLLFSCMYIDFTDSWVVSSVENKENHHIYWVQKGMENKVDLYDYNTDTLISAQSETFAADPVKEFESQVESINADFDERLESIADKYQLNESK